MSAIAPSQATDPLLQYPEDSSPTPADNFLGQQIIHQNGIVFSSDCVVGMEGRQIFQLPASEKETETVDTQTTVQKRSLIKEAYSCLTKIGGILTLITCSLILCFVAIVTGPCREDD